MAKKGSDEWKSNVRSGRTGIRTGESNPWSSGKQSEDHIQKRVEGHARAIKSRGEFHSAAMSGENHHKTNLTNKDVLDIVSMIQKGTKRKVISEIFGISLSGIGDIVSGRNWSSVTGIVPKVKGEKDV